MHLLGCPAWTASARLLPNHHLSKETQDIVKLSAGTIATLTAMVLGLLVSSAKNSFDTMNNGVVQSSAKIILLDRDLARYGPETKAAREQLKRTVAGVMEMVWPAEKTDRAFPDAGGNEKLRLAQPKLVAQIEFVEWTPDGHLRLRGDKDPREVVREN
jgi:hypothetical protein